MAETFLFTYTERRKSTAVFHDILIFSDAPLDSMTLCVACRSLFCFVSEASDGLWSCDKPTVLKLGVLPIKAMLAVEEHLWASSGGQVFIISTHTHRVEVGDLPLTLPAANSDSGEKEEIRTDHIRL